MFGRSEIQRCLFGVAALLILSSVPPALAGGFGIAVEIPPASSSERSHKALLLVRPAGCRGPGASVSVTAEGLVNGRRRSVPLRLTPVSTDTYAVQRQWPAVGAWVLAITARSRWMVPGGKTHTAVCRALVELGPDGSVPSVSLSGDGKKHLPVRYVSGRAEEIGSALQALADKRVRETRITRSAR